MGATTPGSISPSCPQPGVCQVPSIPRANLTEGQPSGPVNDRSTASRSRRSSVCPVASVVTLATVHRRTRRAQPVSRRVAETAEAPTVGQRRAVPERSREAERKIHGDHRTPARRELVPSCHTTRIRGASRVDEDHRRLDRACGGETSPSTGPAIAANQRTGPGAGLRTYRFLTEAHHVSRHHAFKVQRHKGVLG